MNDDGPLVTRNQAVQIVRTELGIPIGKSAIEKAAMNGTGPAAAACYGRTHLYKKSVVLEWARSLIAPVAA